MADPANPHDEDHIEELLSQLQGIFGKLSHSEEEESSQKLDIPAAPEPPALRENPPPPTPVQPLPAVPLESGPAEAPPLPEAQPEASMPPEEPLTQSPPFPEPVSFEPPPTAWIAPDPAPQESVETIAPAPPPVELPAPPILDAVAFESCVPADAPAAIPAAVYYPVGREHEGRVLANRLENLIPKFTKVAFQLRVALFSPYDPRDEGKDALLAAVSQATARAFFLMIERPIEEIRRKAIISELEAKKIYFQEVPLLSVEKKAFYTDLLLGLVFFFDSIKSPES